MRINKSWAAVLLAGLFFASCDDTTDEIGGSLVDNIDRLNIATDTFSVSTRSIIADSVLARNTTGYLGKVRDPETGTYVTCNYMTQFHSLDNYIYPNIDSIVSKNGAGQVIADSCELRVFLSGFYGDSLATMKLTAYEMDKPMVDNGSYYSDYDPLKKGYVRDGGIKKTKVYTLHDYAERAVNRNIRIKLNEPYTDKDGKSYENYGTYVMRKFYEDPKNFANSFKFTNNVVPGFYFANSGGLGSMADVQLTQLNIYFRYIENDSVYVGTSSFAGTEEALSTTNVVNDKEALKRLAADNTCTYLKTPAGIFTEVTLPVDEIYNGHENDSINSAKVVFTCINNKVESDYSLSAPSTLLMIPLDSLHSFFDNEDIANYRTSFLATLNTSSNTYTFNNVSSLVKAMYANKKSGSANWNKAVLVPVQTTYSSLGSNSTVLTSVINDMAMSSTRLVGGSENTNSPIRISVVYSKNK
ncbi:MAG: DUF4270 domain-containing protein [Prevotella sp.]|nr:DUF4270 domain-containing protein [Prevotella sp.]